MIYCNIQVDYPYRQIMEIIYTQVTIKLALSITLGNLLGNSRTTTRIESLEVREAWSRILGVPWRNP